ncbi:hypothetical protein AAHB54_04835, partial [Bacillus cereus]
CTSFSFKFGCLTFREQTKLRVFRIYRETLSRFRAPLNMKFFSICCHNILFKKVKRCVFYTIRGHY